MRRLFVVGVAAVIAAGSLSCTGDGPTGLDARSDTTWVWPTGDDRMFVSPWQSVRPVLAGFDSVRLDSALRWAGQDQTSLTTLVLWRGRIVAENLWSSATLRTWFETAGPHPLTAYLLYQTQPGGIPYVSDTQSVTGILGSGWSAATPEQEAAVTIGHLAAMTAGLDDSLRYVAPPGDQFHYSPLLHNLLIQSIYERRGLRYEDGDSPWQTADGLPEEVGVFLAYVYPGPADVVAPVRHFSWTTSARDLARLGVAVLRGNQWRELVLHPAPAAHDRRSGANPAFARMWWRNDTDWHIPAGPPGVAAVSGPLIPEAPADAIMWLGENDQRLYIIPSRDLVILRTGPRAPISGAPADHELVTAFDREFWSRLSASFLPAAP